MIVNHLLTIDEISGILDHSPSCKQLLEMDQNASIPLHPDLKAFALSLLRDNIPLAQLRQMCIRKKLKWLTTDLLVLLNIRQNKSQKVGGVPYFSLI